jgi:hypothetical protein
MLEQAQMIQEAARSINAPQRAPETLVQWWIEDLQRGRAMTRQEQRVQRLRDKYGAQPVDVGVAVAALAAHFERIAR